MYWSSKIGQDRSEKVKMYVGFTQAQTRGVARGARTVLFVLYKLVKTFYGKPSGLHFHSGARGAPWVSKFGNPLIRKILVLTSAYVRPSVQTLGEGEGSPKTTRLGEAECSFFFLVAEVNIMAAGSSYAILNCKTFLE